MNSKLTVKVDVRFGAGRPNRETVQLDERKTPPPGRIPRVAKLMALAIRFERLIAEGVVTDQAELARLGHVTRARVTQIMNLLNLAPDLQEALLWLPPVEQGRDPLTERDLRPIVAIINWRKQRRLWDKLFGDTLGTSCIDRSES